MDNEEEGPPWVRLFLVCCSLAIGAGLTPAASAYTAFFVKHGVCSNWLCHPGETSCSVQEAFIGEAILQAGVVAKMQEIAGAYSFQRYGGKKCLKMSSAMHMFGWLLFGYCVVTHYIGLVLWSLAIYLIDMSRGLIKYIPYCFLTAFPGQSGVVLALGNGGHQAASVFALVLMYVSDFINIRLTGLSIWQAALGLGLLMFGPRMLPDTAQEEAAAAAAAEAEEEDTAQEDGKAPQKKPEKEGACDETCRAYKDTYFSLLPKLPLHLFVVFTFGIGPLWSAQYQAISVVWGNLLFPGNQTNVDRLASSIAISTFVTNCFVSPVVARFLPKIGLWSVAAALSAMQFLSSMLAPTPALWAQLFIGFTATLMYAVEPALQGEHLFAFVDLRFAGMAAFVWSQFIFVAYSNGTNWESGMMTKAASAPEGAYNAYKDTLRYCINIGAYAYGAYSIIMVLFPLPERPIVSSRKQAELSVPYACTNFDQVSKVIRYNLDLTEKALLQQQARDERSLAELISRSHVPSFRARLEQITYEEISQLVESGNLFWKPTHVPVKSSGFMMAGVAMPAAQFESMLRTVADVDAFGSGHAKSLAFLKDELAGKRASFEFDEENPDMLVRVTTIIVLRITVRHQNQTYYLLEVGSKYSDGSVKKAFRYPAEKKLIGGSVDAAIQKLLGGLGIKSDQCVIDKQNPELFMETQASESYPGLLTRYDKKLVAVQIDTTQNDSFPDIGLAPEPVPWQVSHEGAHRLSVSSVNDQAVKQADLFEWLRKEQIREREPSFMITYPKPKSNRPSPESLGMDISTLMLHRRNVVELLRRSRADEDSKLKDMFAEAETATYIRSLPFWLLDEQFEYHNNNILSSLCAMVSGKKQKPDHMVMAESMILDLHVHKFKAKLRRRASMKL